MKPLLIILILILFIALPAFSEYKPINKEYSLQYKNEIEKIIKKQVPASKEAINGIFLEIEKEQNQYVKLVIIEQGINSILFDFYIELINITDKYTDIKKDIPATDWYGDLKNIIYPYLIDNNINVEDINALLKYANKKQIEFERKNK